MPLKEFYLYEFTATSIGNLISENLYINFLVRKNCLACHD